MADGVRSHELPFLLGLGLPMLKRWRRQFAGHSDGIERPKSSHRHVAHRLSEEERQRILLTCNEPVFAACPPGRPCRSWRIAACITPMEKPAATALSAAFTGCSMPTTRFIGVVEQGHHSSRAKCHGSGPLARIRCGVGTSPACPPPCVAFGSTSLW